MLSERFSAQLETLLVPLERYAPFPTAEERAAWDGLPNDLRGACLAAAEEARAQPWPALPATLFMEFSGTGNRSHYEAAHFRRRSTLGALVIAECLEGKSRLLDDIVDAVWSICEESFWGIPAHSSASRFPGAPLPDTAEPIIDLFAAETGSLLTLTIYLLRARLDALSPVVSDRVRREIKARIQDPYLTRNDFWWMGLSSSARDRVNNWTPWCTSNCLACFLMLEDDPGRRTAAVRKALLSLDAFLESYHSDGACDEGTSYWDRAGGSLFDCLELLHGGTNGAIDIYGEPLVARIGQFLYRAYIGGDYFINFADGGARVGIAADLVYRYGQRIRDPKLMALGSSAHHRQRTRSPAGESLLRVLPALFHWEQIETATAGPPLERDAWLDGVEVMAAREREGSERGLYVAAKGGHNNESHNHNDVGQFIVDCEARPVLIDLGVETYTAKTFSARRFEIWTMQSAYHNLPTIDGIQQAVGREFAARNVRYEMDDSHAQISLDIAGAYSPEAGAERWQRTVRLDRGAAPRVTLREEFSLTRPSPVVLSLMAASEPTIERPGVIRFDQPRTLYLEYPTDLDAIIEPIPITDDHLRAVWGEELYRILLSTRGPVVDGAWELTLG